jgi:predicted dehydrogenase
MSVRATLGRRLRYGMVGGGPGAFIGIVHRRAAALDGYAELVAGAFSADAARSAQQGRELGLDTARVYADFRAMAEREAAAGPERRIDFVVIVTPNHLHHDAAAAFLEHGFHVVCDKPLTTRLADAEALCRQAARAERVFAVTHNYTGYPLVKQVRALVQAGALGAVRKVVVDYAQGWLAEPIERAGQKQAEWRTDPARAGAGALGDIGTHAFNLAHYATGLELEQLCADVSTFVPGRRVDDDAAMLFRYHGGARGVLSCSQVAAGEENNMRLRIHGSEASIEWQHAQPNQLIVRGRDGQRVLTRGGPGLAEAAQRASRLPAGHPEGFLEAFANVYANALRTIAALTAGASPDPLDLDFPTVQDGARGVHFIESALRSSAQGGWVDASYTPPG